MSAEVLPPLAGPLADARIESFTGSYHPAITLVTVVDPWRATKYLTSADATSLRLVKFHGDLEPVGVFAIDALTDLTGLSTERLAYALGASRRSLYNWRHGGSVRPEVEDRIKQTYRFLKSAVVSRPRDIGPWLERGDPPAIDLMHRGEWERLHERLHAESAPRVARRLEQEEFDDAPQRFAAATHALMLHSFASSPATGTGPRPGWRPRELTGLGEEESDDE